MAGEHREGEIFMIDLHCDTVLKLMDYPGTGLAENSFSVDLGKLRQAGAIGQFFALFVDKQKYPDSFKRCQAMARLFLQELAVSPDYIRLVRNGRELRENHVAGRISAFLTIEEGGVLQGSLDTLQEFYHQGVRLITLTWNYPNEIGYSHLQSEELASGLTAFGCELVEAMQALGMIIDVSHLSDQGFYDVASLVSRPFIASHSNCRSVTRHSRNLSDDMIHLLADKGGVMGLNFANHFLGASPVSRLDDMVTHVKHMRKVGGIDVIALGTDFDGINCSVEIAHSGQLPKLFHALRLQGFTEEEVEKIAWKNALRVIDDTLK